MRRRDETQPESKVRIRDAIAYLPRSVFSEKRTHSLNNAEEFLESLDICRHILRDFVLNLIKDYPISYPVVLDVESEQMSALTPSALADVINAFCRKIENAGFDLGGQKASFSVYVSGVKDYLLKKSVENLNVNINAKVAALKFDELYDYWPRYLGTVAWDWCKESISGGEIKNAEFNFDFGYDTKNKKFAFRKLSGTGQIADSNLNYLEGMPLITNMYGTATFTNDTIKIDVDKAVSDNVFVNGGYVRLYDLDKYDNFADISLEAEITLSHCSTVPESSTVLTLALPECSPVHAQRIRMHDRIAAVAFIRD